MFIFNINKTQRQCSSTQRFNENTPIHQAVERFKELVQRHYKEPTNGKFDDCTKEVTKRSMSRNPLTEYWAIVFDIVNVVVANIDFLSVFVA